MLNAFTSSENVRLKAILSSTTGKLFHVFDLARTRKSVAVKRRLLSESQDDSDGDNHSCDNGTDYLHFLVGSHFYRVHFLF